MGSADLQGRLWGGEARDWAELQEPLHRPLWEAMLDVGNVDAGSRVLDVGCGGGGASLLAAERGARVMGLDAAENLVDVARDQVPDGEFTVGDMENLPYPDHSVDAVITANSIQYAADRTAAAREMKRVCIPGKRVVVGIWGEPGKVDFGVIFEAIGKHMSPAPDSKGPFELSEPGVLDRILREAGLEVVGAGEAMCPFTYPDFETFLRANLSAGPAQAVLQRVPFEELSSSLESAVEPFRKDAGSIEFRNTFRYTVAEA